MILVALTEIHLQVVRVGWVGKVEHVERHPRGTCCGARRRPLLHPGAWKAGGGSACGGCTGLVVVVGLIGVEGTAL